MCLEAAGIQLKADAGNLPEAAAVADQYIVGFFNEQAVAKQFGIGVEGGVHHAAHFQAAETHRVAVVDVGARFADQFQEQAVAGFLRRWRIFYGKGFGLLAAVAGQQFDIGTGQDGAQAADTLAPDSGFDHPELRVAVEHALGVGLHLHAE